MFGRRRRVLFDPGSFNAKLLVVGRSIVGKRRLTFHSFRRDAREPMVDLLRRISRETETGGAVWTLSVPAGACHLRELNFPFDDMDKIKAVLDHELARVLPFPLKGAEIRLVSTWPTARGGRGVLVAVIPGDTINELKGDFRQAGLALESIVTEYEAISALFLSAPRQSDERPATLVDLGDNQTLVCTFAGGRLRYARCLTMGLGMIRQGSKPTEQGPEDLLAAEIGETAHHPAAAAFLQGLDRELHLSLTVSGEAVQEPVNNLYISGGGADVPGMSAHLEETIGAKAHNWQELLLPSISEQLTSPDAPARRYWSPAIVSGLAALTLNVALQSRFKSSMIKDETDPRTLGVVIMILFCLATALHGAGLWIKARRWQASIASLERQFDSSLKRYFPHAEGKGEPLTYLRKTLPQMTRGKQMLASMPGRLLDVVKELTLYLPGPPDLTLEKIGTEGGMVTVKGRTLSYGHLETLKAEIEESPVFSTVTVKTATKIRDNSKNEVGFELEMVVAQ